MLVKKVCSAGPFQSWTIPLTVGCIGYSTLHLCLDLLSLCITVCSLEEYCKRKIQTLVSPDDITKLRLPVMLQRDLMKRLGQNWGHLVQWVDKPRKGTMPLLSTFTFYENHPPTGWVFECAWNWMAPGKPTPSNNFVAIVQVAQNPLKCAMLTLFVLKNAPFFQEGRRIWTKLHENPPPPPHPPCPSPNNVGFRSLRAKHCACVLYAIGGRRWSFKNVFEALFPHLWKKKDGHFFTEKELAWQSSAVSEQHGKSLRIFNLGLASMDPLTLSLPSSKNTFSQLS